MLEVLHVTSDGVGFPTNLKLRQSGFGTSLATTECLLEKYGVGVIADGERDIRVAFSAVEASELEDLFAQIGAAAKDLLEGNGTKG